MSLTVSILLFTQYRYYLITKKIVAVFKDNMLTYDIDKKSVDFEECEEAELIVGFDELFNKVGYFVQCNKPIILTMVGFPYKSSNTKDKVLASSIDAAEYYSLCYLQKFLDEIKRNYHPGARLYIFTDGIVFCDIEKVPDTVVIEYEDNLKKIAQDMRDIVVVTTRDICLHKTSQEIRTLICDIYPSVEEFNVMVLSDKKLQNDIDVLSERITFELALLSPMPDELAQIGFQETHRSMQLTTFLKQFRPVEAIACSVHYQKNVGRKIGLKLSESYVTSWHGVLIEDGDGQEPRIMHLKDVDMSAYQKAYVMVNGLELVYLKKL